MSKETYQICSHADKLTGSKLAEAAANLYAGREDYSAVNPDGTSAVRLLGPEQAHVVLDSLDAPPPDTWIVAEKFEITDDVPDSPPLESKAAFACRKWIATEASKLEKPDAEPVVVKTGARK